MALDRADYDSALKIWLGTEEGGDPEVQYYVGVLYKKGAEGLPNYVKAASWYRQAVGRRSRRAAVNLGWLYGQGLDVEKNIAEARTWCAKANESRDGR